MMCDDELEPEPAIHDKEMPKFLKIKQRARPAAIEEFHKKNRLD